jgi:copper chaperone CopZ
MKSQNKLAGLGVLTAISASLCCITPVLALLAGTSGLASTFSWIDPLRPYMIGLTVLVLGFAWYQNLKPQKQMDCNCCDTNEKSFMQSKSFLGIVTVFAGLMLAFPSYAHIFLAKTEKKTIVQDQKNIETSEFSVTGMTCTGCEDHVNHELNKLPGIILSKVSYQNSNAIVKFDKTLTDREAIEKAIAKAGYAANLKTHHR